jgi:hypothetical protein
LLQFGDGCSPFFQIAWRLGQRNARFQVIIPDLNRFAQVRDRLLVFSARDKLIAVEEDGSS